MAVKHKFKNKKRKEEHIKYLYECQNKIIENTDKIWIPRNIEYVKKETNSCFDQLYYYDKNVKI